MQPMVKLTEESDFDRIAMTRLTIQKEGGPGLSRACDPPRNTWTDQAFAVATILIFYQ